MIENRRERPIWLAYTAALVALAALFPLCGDDWGWAVVTEFSTFNGRYLGNFMVRVMTQNLWIRPFITGIVIGWITWGVTGFRKGWAPVAMVLMLGLNRDMFNQVYQWTSGFVNYTLPVALIFLTLWAARKALGASRGAGRYGWTGLAVVSGVLTQFCSEHITIATVLLTGTLLIYQTVKKLEGRGVTLAVLLAYAAGALVMFLNPAYWEGQSDAHTMPTIREMIDNLWVNYEEVIAPHLLAGNTLLLLAITVTLFLVIASAERRHGLGTLLQWGLGLLTAFFLLLQIHSKLLSWKSFLVIRAVAVMAYFALAAVVVFRYLPAGRKKDETVFSFLAAALSAGPLLAVDPIGGRCLYICYAALALGVFHMLAYLKGADALPKLPGFRRILAACVVLSLGFYFVIYGWTTYQVQLREQSMAEQLEAGATELKILYLTFGDEYTFGANLYYSWGQTVFRRYYGLPDDMQLHVVSEWPIEW